VTSVRYSLAVGSERIEDLVCAFVPDKGLWLFIPPTDPVFDGRLEFFRRAVGAPSESLIGEFSEPTFHQVHPRAVGGREVEVKPRVAHESSLDLWGLVRRDVVHDEMDVQIVGNRSVDQVQELSELDRPMTIGHEFPMDVKGQFWCRW
jgi:hypothetical protein